MNTKNKITRAECQKNLMADETFDLRFNLFMLAMFLVLFVPMTIVGIRLFVHTWFMGLPFFIVFPVPPIIFIYKVINNLLTLRLIARGGFSIVKDTVALLSREPNRKRTGEINAIYLSKYGRILPSDAVFDISSVGDEFYAVVLHNKNKTVTYTYHTEMYVCDEVNEE